MTRTYKTLVQSLFGIVLAAGLVSAAPSAAAQQKVANYTVPFAFSVNDHILPAGSYRVDMSSPTSVTLIDRNSAKSVGTFLIRNESDWEMATHSRLTFRRTGSEMTLVQVAVAGSSSHGALAPPRKIDYRELGSLKSAPRPTQIEIASN